MQQQSRQQRNAHQHADGWLTTLGRGERTYSVAAGAMLFYFEQWAVEVRLALGSDLIMVEAPYPAHNCAENVQT